MLAFVSLRDDGERSFMFYRHPSADMLMTPADVATNIIDTARIFHFGSISMINSPAREATLAAADHARTHDTLISYDPNLRMALWQDAESARIGMRRGLDYAHLLKVSDDELDFMLNEDESLRDLWQQYEQMQLIILTRGKHGAILYSRNGAEVSHDGYAVDAVDTTGAGDAFVAGMLVNILKQLNAGDTLQTLDYSTLLDFACATGALTTTGRGAIPSLPTREAAQDFIAAQNN
jgi:fructokinase